MLISRQNEIFTTWKFSKFQIFQICVRYCYKSSANDIIPHYCLKEAIKIFSLKKTIQLLKIFILSEKCLSVARMCFYKVKILKIWNFQICARYGLKSIPGEIISYFCRREEIKTFSLEKKFQLLKILILSQKCLSVAKTHFCKLKLLKFWYFKFGLGMVLNVSQARLYHIPAEEKRQNT